MQNHECSKCGGDLPASSLKYIVGINIFADFDGHINSDTSHEDIEKLLIQIDASDPEELEEDVHKEIYYLLCKSCKDSLVQQILVHMGRETSDSARIPNKLH